MKTMALEPRSSLGGLWANSKENALRDEALANAVLSRALLDQGKADDARSAIDRSLALAEKYHDRQVEFFVAVTAARVGGTSNTPAARDDAVSRLQQIIAEANRTGFVTCAFEARLALGEIEILSGNRSSGLAHLESLRKEANDRGLGLIAREATLAMKPTS